MTPIEAAARALAKQQSGVDDWDGLDETLQEALKDEVRAVLLAIRLPSEAMLQAGEAKHEYPEADGIWADMIDAALEEG